MTAGPVTAARVRRDGDAMVFEGTVDRAACAPLWAQARPLLAGAARINLASVERVDSAGLALLAELAALGGIGTIDGVPEGLAELRAAYRLDPALAYAG
jgi:phospholipid transport system transporter-binding protein